MGSNVDSDKADNQQSNVSEIGIGIQHDSHRNFNVFLQRRRRRSPRARSERRARRRQEAQLTRSLERIHRKRADRDHPSLDDLKRTYTGLDR